MNPARSPPAAARRELHVDEQAVTASSIDRQSKVAVHLPKLQSAMWLEGRQQDRDHHLEELSADPIRRLP
ncbi:hypothetical protein BSZ19_12235 [Bradyrhizobium japonicum]|uniref:Uncharacterized protein n=1 Tax=Bradyrhizobium japonicum TaxID=375 RepID=A0A1Y2JUP8_BRAJP|nr:hypothetical protein BSZ19_12235 [Bradyrhizobium japonicum]